MSCSREGPFFTFILFPESTDPLQRFIVTPFSLSKFFIVTQTNKQKFLSISQTEWIPIFYNSRQSLLHISLIQHLPIFNKSDIGFLDLHTLKHKPWSPETRLPEPDDSSSFVVPLIKSGLNFLVEVE